MLIHKWVCGLCGAELEMTQKDVDLFMEEIGKDMSDEEVKSIRDGEHSSVQLVCESCYNLFNGGVNTFH